MPLETDPRDLELDDENDLVIDTDLHWTTGIEAVVQGCRIALQMFQGEWFLDLDAGIPYWDQILAQKPDVAIAAATMAFNDALLAIDGVSSILLMDIQYDNNTRTLSVRWQVRCVFGDTPVDTIALSVGGT